MASISILCLAGCIQKSPILKKMPYIVVFLSGLVAFCSCQSSKQLAYFQDLPDTALVNKIKSLPYEPLKLQANDEVQVTITSTSPEASQFFNLVAVTPVTTSEAAL